jgi:hypothetical protein
VRLVCGFSCLLSLVTLQYIVDAIPRHTLVQHPTAHVYVISSSTVIHCFRISCPRYTKLKVSGSILTSQIAQHHSLKSDIHNVVCDSNYGVWHPDVPKFQFSVLAQPSQGRTVAAGLVIQNHLFSLSLHLSIYLPIYPIIRAALCIPFIASHSSSWS